MEKKQIGQLFDTVTRGKSPSYVDESEVVVINQACIRWDEIDYSKIKYQDPEKIKNGAILQDGDLLITSTGTGTLGRCNVFYAPDDRTYVIDSHVTMMRGTKEIIPEFLKFYMMLDESQGRLYSQCVNGSTNQIELSKEKWSKFIVPVPDIEMQKNCVSILQQIDLLMANCDERITLFDELVKARFVELFGDPITNPKGYTKITVAEAIEDGYIEKPFDGNHGSKHPKASEYVESGIPFLMANNVICGTVDQVHCSFITEERANRLDKGFAKDKDVLITHKGTIGRTAVLRTDYEFVMLTPQVAAYRVKDGITPDYLCGYFATEFFQNDMKLLAAAGGSTRAYAGITAQLQLNLIIPPLDEQKVYTDFIKQVDKSKLIVQKKRDELRVLKQALMQEYFK